MLEAEGKGKGDMEMWQETGERKFGMECKNKIIYIYKKKEMENDISTEMR